MNKIRLSPSGPFVTDQGVVTVTGGGPFVLAPSGTTLQSVQIPAGRQSVLYGSFAVNTITAGEITFWYADSEDGGILSPVWTDYVNNAGEQLIVVPTFVTDLPGFALRGADPLNVAIATKIRLLIQTQLLP